MGEEWRDLRPGDRVVLEATGQPGKFEPKHLHGRHGELLELTRPHGYARVRFDGDADASLVHPESLVKEVVDVRS